MSKRHPPAAPRAMLARNQVVLQTPQQHEVHQTKYGTQHRLDSQASHLSPAIQTSHVQLYERFLKMRQSAHMLGFANSPYLPSNVTAYGTIVSEAKARNAEVQAEKANTIRNQEEKEQEARKFQNYRYRLATDPMILKDTRLFEKLLDSPSTQGPVQPLFLGKEVRGHGISAVLALDDGCFNSSVDYKNISQDQFWPTDAYFQYLRGNIGFPPPQNWRRQ